MAEIPLHGQPACPDARVQFAGRPSSAGWEQIVLDSAANFFWIWFKPPTVPQGLVIRIPEETYRGGLDRLGLAGEQLTIRTLLRAAGIDSSSVAMCYLYGAPCEGRNGTSPAFDQPLAGPLPGGDPNIIVLIEAPIAESSPVASPCVATMGADLVKVFDEMEADWSASLLLEKQLMLARKQLTGTLGRLAALDRDLSPEERLHGDRQDKSDWLEVRRSLKDAAVKLSRYIKEHDVGETSAAGKRDWFQQTYRHYVAPRQPFDGLLPLHREFESYRKRLQVLLSNMNLANTNVAQEAERRAQRVLSRLSSRARSAQTKTTGWTPHRWLNYKQRDSL
jgi:hypothetical protein